VLLNGEEEGGTEMAVRIVHDVDGGGGGRRLVRLVSVVLGSVLVFAGLIAFALPLLYVLFVVDALLNGTEVPVPRGSDLPAFAIAFGITIVGVWVGLRLVRGRRRLGLYLRKFGFSDSTQNVTAALASAGRSVRLVTLDDAMVAPVGVVRSGRRAALWLSLVSLAAVAWGLYWAFGGPFDEAYDSADELTDAGDQFGAALGAIVGLLLVLSLVAIAGALAIFGLRAHAAARRYERLATRAIDNEHEIASTARSIATGSRRVLSPRLVVVRVADLAWQAAVRGIANVSDVVVIDVSQPTDALLWEVGNLKPIFGNRWILVGAHSRVAPLANPQAVAGTPQGLLANLLDGHEVIAYGSGPAEQQRFVRALRRRLHQTRRR
jgi:hypothetical protein